MEAAVVARSVGTLGLWKCSVTSTRPAPYNTMLRRLNARGQKNWYFKETKATPLMKACTPYKYFIRNGAANWPRKLSVNCWERSSTAEGFQLMNITNGVTKAVGTVKSAAKK